MMSMRSYGCLRVRVWPLLSPPLLLLLLLILVLSNSNPLAAQGGASSPRWLTLSGKEPAVIARGGLSGIFPESSSDAYNMVNVLELPSTPLWCNVQMTKDAVAICLANVNLNNCTNLYFPNSLNATEEQTYVINGRNVTGRFSLNYTYEQLNRTVPLIQPLFKRSEKFDLMYQILTVEEAGKFNQSLWLNVEHDLFYKEHDLNITEYILTVQRNVSISHISSAETGFLRNIAPTFAGTKTKLIFHIPEYETIDPSTNQTYDYLLKNLTFIKTFASGILVPKNYIWPVYSRFIQQPNISLVSNVHKDDLELFASGFANDDFFIAYNYSYNPISEYLKFIDNGKFSVDGLLSDYPSTAWEAIRCFSHLGSNASHTENLLVITHHGDSGDYPSCTDLAYKKAINVSADFIDCPVQVTKDGYLVCLSSIDLQKSTTVFSSPFGTRSSKISEIQQEPGFFSFNFTWEEIQRKLKPEISSPLFSVYKLARNPENKNAGAFVTLDQFLGLAKRQNVGVMITMENANFLVEKLGYDIIGRVINALDDAGFKNQTSPKVMIQSSNSSTLIPFREKTEYKILYKLDELARDVDPTALNDIKKFAHAVAVQKSAIFRDSKAYFTRQTKLVETLHSADLEVYVYVLMNECLSTLWDFFGDAIMEIHNYVDGGKVDGVITDFPAASDLYRRNVCSKRNFSIPLVPPGFLTSFMFEAAKPPVQPPLPSLRPSDVLESPLPPARNQTSKVPPTNAQTRASPSLFILLIILVELLCSLKW